ncbi:hypothetical protein M434DRAFT_400102 [Hypoxylon sp. CO27-5]|nr:hypothetical protein M434DRAFT_400102 [Hypoxylon sp. CO27-5]
MTTISDTWLDQEVQEEIATVKQSATMKAYLNGDIQVDETARLMTEDVLQAAQEEEGEAEELEEKLCELWGFIIDFILECPSSHTKIIDLLHTISQFPHIDRVGKDSLETFEDENGVVRESQLWEDLPRFWSSLRDYSASEAAWRWFWTKSSLERGENPSWFNMNAFAATAFKSGPLAGRRLFGNWGCYVLKEAVNPRRELVGIDVPAAAIWMQSAGAELHHFYLTGYKGESSPETWVEWRKAFRNMSNDDTMDATIREKAADIAAAMERASATNERGAYRDLQITLGYVGGQER